MKRRIIILRNIIEYTKSYSDLLADLKSIGWLDETIITLYPQNIKKILQKFIEGELTSNDIENWANLIEGRDDIEYSYNTDIVEIISKLANQSINIYLNKNNAQEMIQTLEQITYKN